MSRIAQALAAVTLAACFGGTAKAQYVGPVYPNYPPAPSYTYPVSPNGIVTGNPSPTYYDPNAVVGRGGGGTAYWDPYRGWVTNTQDTSVLNSATSPGRAPVAGGQIQYYNYWNGTQWVRGSRWLGQDGQWHGDHMNTTVGPNGSSHTGRTLYNTVPAGIR